MRKIDKIVVHCSYSPFGDAEVIREWHLEKGWRDVGYHKIILNGQAKSTKDPYEFDKDGLVEDGRPLEEIGAHVRGYNRNSIGICMVGKENDDYTPKQMHALIMLLHELTKKYDLKIEDIYGHYEFNSDKTCPAMNMESFRQVLTYEFYDIENN